MGDFEDLIRGVAVFIVIGWVFITIGQIYHWFDWVGPTIAFIWQIVQLIFYVLIIIGIIYLIIRIISWILDRREEKRKADIAATEFTRRAQLAEIEAVQKAQFEEIGKTRKKQFEEMGITNFELSDYQIGSHPENQLQQLKDQLIKTQNEHEIFTLGLSRKESLSAITKSQPKLNDFELGSLTEEEFLQLRETAIKEVEEKEKIITRGRNRLSELQELEVPIKQSSIDYLGNMNETDFLQFRETSIKKVEEIKETLRNETQIILFRVQKCHSQDLEDLPQELKDYKSKKWEKQIFQLLTNNVPEKEIIKKLCEGESNGNRNNADFQKIVDIILKYKIPRRPGVNIEDWKKEDYYHSNLFSYLSAIYPSAKMEDQRGSSRPDISIGNIAIEVKGPTYRKDLETIANKLLKYPLHFEESMIIVLFDIQFGNYDEWIQAVKRKHPNTILIEEREGVIKRV